jgi:hypothetical protein
MSAPIVIGLTLIALGLILILLGRARTKGSVHASNGSVAVGGDNTGPIVNTNVHAPRSTSKTGVHWITAAGIIVELVGIGVTMWHALHLVGR